MAGNFRESFFKEELYAKKMISLSIFTFVFTVILGIMMARRIFANRSLTAAVIYSHGAFAIAALALLIAYSVKNQENFPLISLIFFGVAVVGGITMFLRNLINKPGTKTLVLFHAGAAITAFILLLIFAKNI